MDITEVRLVVAAALREAGINPQQSADDKWLNSLPKRVLMRATPVLLTPFGDPYALRPVVWRMPEVFGPINTHHIGGRFWTPRINVPIVPNNSLQAEVEFVIDVFGEKEEVDTEQPLDGAIPLDRLGYDDDSRGSDVD